MECHTGGALGSGFLLQSSGSIPLAAVVCGRGGVPAVALGGPAGRWPVDPAGESCVGDRARSAVSCGAQGGGSWRWGGSNKSQDREPFSDIVRGAWRRDKTGPEELCCGLDHEDRRNARPIDKDIRSISRDPPPPVHPPCPPNLGRSPALPTAAGRSDSSPPSPRMVTCDLSRVVVLVGEMSAQHAAHAVHKGERQACQAPKTSLGAFRKKVRGS